MSSRGYLHVMKHHPVEDSAFRMPLAIFPGQIASAGVRLNSPAMA